LVKLFQTFKRKMKQLFKAVLKFIKREWFLLLTITAIAVIVLMFELF